MGQPELPWLRDKLEALRDALEAGRLPHALLLEGPEGVGKRVLAGELNRLLLCSDADMTRRPCGGCQACRLREAGNHPDYHVLSPEEDKATISVDQVRELSAALALTSQIGAARVGLIVPADAMTHAAANSLLKTLEEPGPGTTLMLLASRPATLPATVRSRCQAVRIGLPSSEVARAWLEERDADRDWTPLLRMAGGAPLKAVELLEAGLSALDERLTADLCAVIRGRADPIEVAERWDKTGPRLCLDWLHGQLLAMARARALAEAPLGDLQKAGEHIHLSRLTAYAGHVLRARSLVDKPVNKRMMLEGLLVPWAHGLEIEFAAAEASIP